MQNPTVPGLPELLGRGALAGEEEGNGLASEEWLAGSGDMRGRIA
jgi:hypothetical protein